jgi:hypothetical protein
VLYDSCTLSRKLVPKEIQEHKLNQVKQPVL